MVKFKITQVRSAIKRPKKQKNTLKAMGLGKINKSIELELTSQVKGMLDKVKHLVNVTKLSL